MCLARARFWVLMGLVFGKATMYVSEAEEVCWDGDEEGAGVAFVDIFLVQCGEWRTLLVWW